MERFEKAGMQPIGFTFEEIFDKVREYLGWLPSSDKLRASIAYSEGIIEKQRRVIEYIEREVPASKRDLQSSRETIAEHTENIEWYQRILTMRGEPLKIKN